MLQESDDNQLITLLTYMCSASYMLINDISEQPNLF